MVDVADKLGYFQAITGLEDADLCTEILQAHGWDLELAISSFTSSSSSSSDPLHNHPSSSRDHNRELFTEFEDDPAFNDEDGRPPGIAWKIITLPVSIVSGSLGLASTAIGFGFRVAGGALTYSLGMLGFGSGRSGGSGSGSGSESVSLSAGEEAMEFISLFDRDYGRNPGFVSEGFMDALQRSRTQFKLLFVYLHSPDHPDTPPFCDRTLCNEGVVAFLNENFVAWGGINLYKFSI